MIIGCRCKNYFSFNARMYLFLCVTPVILYISYSLFINFESLLTMHLKISESQDFLINNKVYLSYFNSDKFLKILIYLI